MRTITITGYRRPHLFRRLLESLHANDLAGWRILARIEPSAVADEFIAVADELLAGCDYAVEINPTRLGVRANPFHLLETVFEQGSQLNIYLEEDLIVAPDMIRLVEWYALNARPEWLCLSLLAGGCGAAGLLSDPHHPELVFAGKSFNSYGFVILRENWYRHFAPVWMVDAPGSSSPEGNDVIGWDWAVYLYLARHSALHAAQPVLARATHTGREDGVHMNPAFHDLAFGDLALATDASCEFHFTPSAELPPTVRRHALLWDQAAQMLVVMSDKQLTTMRLRDALQAAGAREASRIAAAEAQHEEIGQLREQVTTLQSAADHLQRRVGFLQRVMADGARPGPWQRRMWQSLARLAKRRQQWKLVERCYRNLLHTGPDQSLNWVGYGEALRAQAQFTPAEAAYREAIAADPSCAEAWLHLGHMLKRRALPAEAERAFLMACRCAPDLAPARRELLAAGWTMEALSAEVSS